MKCLVFVFFSLFAFNVDANNPETVPLKDLSVFFSGRIISGYNAGKNEFPWQVSVRMGRSYNDPTISMCGGTILNEKFILTAGHCVSGFIKFIIGYGSNYLNQPLNTQTSFKSYLNPNYIASTLKNDIAIIELPSILKFQPAVMSIRLPKLSEKSNFENSVIIASGFGRTSQNSNPSSILKWVDLQIITNANCSKVFGKYVTSSTICARGSNDITKSTCFGDSGGPLITRENDGISTQIGVISFVSSNGCAYGHPSGYARITSFLPWISKITKIRIRV